MQIKKLKNEMISNSIIVGLMTLVSRITGLVRDMVFAHFLGSSRIADLFLIATRIPNTFRAIFADGAFNNTFIPLFSAVANDNDKNKLQKFSRDIFSLLFYVLTIFTIVVLIFMPIIVRAFAGGITTDIDAFNTLVMMCKITFPFLIFVSITRFFAGILETKNRFCLVAFSPAIVNIIGTLGVFVAAKYSLNIAMWAAWAFTIGGIVQACVLFAATAQNGFGIVPYPIQIFVKNFTAIVREKNVRVFTKNIGPGIISGGIYNLNIMISTFFASTISGAVSWIYYAERLVQLPLGIIGIAIGTVLLPRMSAAKKTDETTTYLNKAIKASLLLLVPTAAGLMMLGGVIVSIIYERGAFGIDDTMTVWKALVVLAVGLPFLSLNRYLSIVFYAKHDTKTPMYIAVICAILNVVISFFAVRGFGYLGVAIASVAITIVNFLLLYFAMLWKKIGQIYASTFWFFVKTIISTYFMGIGIAAVAMVADNFGNGDDIMSKIFALTWSIIQSVIIYFIIFGLITLIEKIALKIFIDRPKF